MIRDWAAFLRRCWDCLSLGRRIELGDASTLYKVEHMATSCESSVYLHVDFLYLEALLQDGIDMMATHHHTDRSKIQDSSMAKRRLPSGQRMVPTDGKWQLSMHSKYRELN